MDNTRFYFRFRWWHSLLILLVLILGFIAWASTWDFEPEVTPRFFPTPSLEVANKAWVGYNVEPFEIRFIDKDNDIPLVLHSAKTQFVKARGTTNIPLQIKAGELGNLKLKNLLSIRVQSTVTASRWGLSRTVVVNKNMNVLDLMGQALKITTDALSQLP